MNLDVLKGLDDQQKVVVTSTEGRYLVLAGAGSGKSRSLTVRVAYILDQHLATPDNILVVTFTNKAAREIKERITKATGLDSRSIWVGTFHSICVKILVAHGTRIGIPKGFTIADEDDKYRELKNLFAEKPDQETVYNASDWISKAKEKLLTPQDLRTNNVLEMPDDIISLYERYQNRLSQIYALDFDDLVMRTLQLLQMCPDVLKHYQQRFKYVMLDECQDSSPSNHRFAELMSGGYGNLMLVGKNIADSKPCEPVHAGCGESC